MERKIDNELGTGIVHAVMTCKGLNNFQDHFEAQFRCPML